MSLKHDIDRIAAIKADIKSALESIFREQGSQEIVGDRFADYAEFIRRLIVSGIRPGGQTIVTEIHNDMLISNDTLFSNGDTPQTVYSLKNTSEISNATLISNGNTEYKSSLENRTEIENPTLIKNAL